MRAPSLIATLPEAFCSHVFLSLAFSTLRYNRSAEKGVDEFGKKVFPEAWPQGMEGGEAHSKLASTEFSPTPGTL